MVHIQTLFDPDIFRLTSKLFLPLSPKGARVESRELAGFISERELSATPESGKSRQRAFGLESAYFGLRRESRRENDRGSAGLSSVIATEGSGCAGN